MMMISDTQYIHIASDYHIIEIKKISAGKGYRENTEKTDTFNDPLLEYLIQYQGHRIYVTKFFFILLLCLLKQ